MSDDVIVIFGADASELEASLAKLSGQMGGLGDAASQANGQAASSSDAATEAAQKQVAIQEQLVGVTKQQASAQEKLDSLKYNLGDIDEQTKMTNAIAAVDDAMEAESQKLQNLGMSADDAKDKLARLRAIKLKMVEDNGAKDMAADYEKNLRPMGTAFASTINGMLFHQKSLKQAVASATSSMLQSYISMEASALAHWVATTLAKISAEKMFGVAMQSEAAKTAATEASSQAARTSATQAGVGARTAVENSGDAGFFSRIAQQLAKWLGLETAKTTATTTEAGTRSSEEAATAAASIAAAKAEAAGEIPAFAAIGAAAAMASVAAIPVIGWAMAPGVGAETYAQGMSYLAMASAAGGWEKVPYDGALTELHKDEMVLPASVANTVRAASSAVGAYGLPSQSKQWANPAQPAVASSASSAGGGQPVTLNYTPSISAINTQGARDFLDQHGRYIVDVLSRQQRNFAQVKK